MYRKISCGQDATALQGDLSRIHDWCKQWQMCLNAKKCIHMCFTKKQKPLINNYCIDKELVTTVDVSGYLGVVFSADCSWNAHISEIVGKAGRALNFVQRNLRCREIELKRNAFTTCVRPILEYACPLWDPSEASLTSQIESIQNRAARYVLGRYRRDSVTMMKQELNWELLSSRRRKLRLKLFFQIYNNKVGINKDTYLKSPFYLSQRNDHKLKIREYRPRTCMFANSFFPKCVADWNKLSEKQVCCANEDLFVSLL